MEEFSDKYDYQHGYCRYFAYNIIDRFREIYDTEDVNYYLILCDLIYDFDEGEVEDTTLVHVYIKIDDKFIDSNGVSTKEQVNDWVNTWLERNNREISDDYRLEIRNQVTTSKPINYFSEVCNQKIINRDVKKFLTNPEIKKLLNIK